ncbi:MAG: GDYXXLXY domain-containing protein [Desulfobacteraceae bacterium]|nr:GDYXXLXY domain-containing protein [Desulfobacteraceae bacterium]
MKPWGKGLVIAVVHLCLVASLGAKLLYDRATRPRVWVLTVPFDPELPVRGRYVSLQLVVEPKGMNRPEQGDSRRSTESVVLRPEGERLVAEACPSGRTVDSSCFLLQWVARDGRDLAVLSEPAAFFIPEHVPDPSRRPPGEELWIEVTVPKTGPPRPIRLGVKSGDGPVVPLEID